MPRRGMDTRRRRALAVVPTRAARAASSSATRSEAWRRWSRRSSSSSSASATPTAHGRAPPLRRRALARVHGRRGLRSTRGRSADAPVVRRARARGVRRQPRVHELAVRDQPEALGRARRRRPRVHAQGGGEGDRRARGAARDVHGPAVLRSGRLGLPSPPLARRRGRAATRSPTRTAPRRPEPARRAASSPACSSTRQGSRRCSGRRSTPTSASFPTASPRPTRNWGHDNRTAFCRVPNERGSRSRVEIRTGDGSACAHLIVARPARRARRDRARARPSRPGRRGRLPGRRRARRLAAAGRPWRGARRARGRHGARRRARRQLVSTFVAMKRFEVERFGEAVGELDVETVTDVGAGGVCGPSLSRRAGASGSSSTATRGGVGSRATDPARRRHGACPRRRRRISLPAEPTKILAVHLTYRSRIEEYRARTPPEPSYFMKPPTTLNGHRRPVRGRAARASSTTRASSPS